MGLFDVSVSIDLDRPPPDVWAYLSDVSSHVEWMQDARSLEFRSEQRHGAGTSYNCLTVLGPLRTTDIITITEWEEGRRMGISHSGIVKGSGHFTLRPAGAGTRFDWFERLHFPWFFAGPIGEVIAAPLFRWVWRRNLAELKRRVEALPQGHGDV